MDAITREAILALTKRVADLEATVGVQRAMLKESAHTQSIATGTSFDGAAFDMQMTEAVLEQREKTAMGVDEPPLAPAVLVLPDPTEPA